MCTKQRTRFNILSRHRKTMGLILPDFRITMILRDKFEFWNPYIFLKDINYNVLSSFLFNVLTPCYHLYSFYGKQCITSVDCYSLLAFKKFIKVTRYTNNHMTYYNAMKMIKTMQ